MGEIKRRKKARKNRWTTELLQELLKEWDSLPRNQKRGRILATKHKININEVFIMISAAQSQKLYNPKVFFENGIKITRFDAAYSDSTPYCATVKGKKGK